MDKIGKKFKETLTNIWYKVYNWVNNLDDRCPDCDVAMKYEEMWVKCPQCGAMYHQQQLRRRT